MCCLKNINIFIRTIITKSFNEIERNLNLELRCHYTRKALKLGQHPILAKKGTFLKK